MWEVGIQTQRGKTRVAAQVIANWRAAHRLQEQPQVLNRVYSEQDCHTELRYLSLHGPPAAQRLKILLCVGHTSRAYREKLVLGGGGNFQYHMDYLDNTIKWSLALQG